MEKFDLRRKLLCQNAIFGPAKGGVRDIAMGGVVRPRDDDGPPLAKWGEELKQFRTRRKLRELREFREFKEIKELREVREFRESRDFKHFT